MLASAKYKESTEFLEEQIVYMKKGEFIFGRESWSKKWDITESKLKTLMKNLIKDNMIIKVKQYNKFTVYKIVNYEKYNSNYSQQDDQQQNLSYQRLCNVDDRQDDLMISGSNPPKDQQIIYINPANVHIQERKEGNKKEISNSVLYDIFDLYVKQEIVNHRNLTKKMEISIKKALRKYSVEEIKLGIERYGQIYRDKGNQYAIKFGKYKWTLDELLTREKGISEFLDEGGKWIRYIEASKNVSETINQWTNIDS
jgi:hypothetical protein